ncbi:MULE domain-containing protein [Aphis craccivora]|uniref:MULE domain-containing protein n=1 Tax=Aphis craccivora TaxID=307492 RepID=A0A6G0YMU7_APHCR|nr:MULE domain-containing protein [Aphis craccivora]
MATEQAYISFFRVVRNMLPSDYDGLRIITDMSSIVRYCRHKYNLVLDLIKTNPVNTRVLQMYCLIFSADRGNESCPNFCINYGFRTILDFAHQNIEVYQRMETFLIGYGSLRPGKDAGDPTVTNIKAIRYNCNGTIDYKLDFNHEYSDLDSVQK